MSNSNVMEDGFVDSVLDRYVYLYHLTFATQQS